MPYVREVLENFRDKQCTDMTLMFGAQVTKTMVIMCGVCWMIDNDPQRVLWVMPNASIGGDFSSSRWQPMLRESPTMARHIPSDRHRFNKMAQYLEKNTINFAGSNSPAQLASRPCPVVIQDETDKFAPATSKEAGACYLADQRAKKAHRPFRVKTSTPTDEIGEITLQYEAGDMRRFFVPCPHCEKKIVLEFEQIKWSQMARRGKNDWDLELVKESAHYQCQECGGKITDNHKTTMIQKGEWVATNPNGAIGHRSYHLPSWYAPWPSCTFAETALKFLNAKKTFNLDGFDNSEKAEPTRTTCETIDDDLLYNRREIYESEVPEDVLVITCGVDTQDNRLEAQLIGWGMGYENWSLEYEQFDGNPSQPRVWTDFYKWLCKKRRLPISMTLIDSGGHKTTEVYKFCRQSVNKNPNCRMIYPCKGSSTPWRPIIGRPSTRNKERVKLYPVGTENAKSAIFNYLEQDKHGPGYAHFPYDYPESYFHGLASERLETKMIRGRPVKSWVQVRTRNEPLDTFVYALGALHCLPDNILEIMDKKRKLEEEKKEQESEKKPPAKKKKFVTDF